MDGAPPPACRTDGCRHLTKLGHVPALDGLRGVAVAAVLVFHGGVSWAPGGFLGVDVFFVLSGFLITTLLLEEAASSGGRISLVAFWSRRVRRLVPALAVVCLAVVVAAPWIAEARSATSVRFDAAAALSYVANWRFILTDTAYFDRTAGPSPLEHTWSLAVEEQFYLAWPLLAVALRGAPWRLAAVALAGAVASVGAMALVYTPGASTGRAYFGTDARVHVVLIGCVLAVVVQWLRARSAEVDAPTRAALHIGSLSGLVLVGGAIITAGGDTVWLYQGGFALVAVGTAFVIADAVLVRNGPLAWMLSALPLRALGWISYGAYLWHWPVYLYLTSERTGLEGSALLGARLAATLAVSVVSAMLIENPIRRGVVLRGVRAAFVLPAVALVLAGALVADAIRVDADVPETVAAAPVPPPLPVAAGEALRVLVVGDSVADTLALWTRNAAAREGIAMTSHAVLGCGIARGGPYRYFGAVEKQPPQCDDWPEEWARVVAETRPHVVLLVVGRWEVMDRTFDGEFTNIGEPAYDDYLAAELDLAVEVLTSTGARLALATAPYYRRGERPDGGIWPEDEEPRVDRFNAIVRTVAAAHPGIVTVVELNAKTTSTPGSYERSVDGIRLRTDGVHFGQAAGRFLAPWLLPQLRALVAPSVP